MAPTYWTIGWEEAAAGAIFLLIWIAFLRLALRCGKGRGSRHKGGLSRRENRNDHRFKSSCRGWLDCAGRRSSLRGIDLTHSGALIAASKEVRVGSEIFVYLTTAGLMGWATVRHCSRVGLFRYQIGLEFRRPLMPSQQGNWQYLSATV